MDTKLAKLRMRAQLFFVINLFCFFLSFLFNIYAQDGDEDMVIDEFIVLPEVEVSAEKDTPETVTREEIDRAGAADLWESVRDLPGVVLSSGGRRNDSSFTIRGYSAESVPIYVDDVLFGNPFRGEGDSARILTGDLESIQIHKGYGTQLLGANAMGGVILMRIAKPQKPLELLSRTTVDFDSVFDYAGVNNVTRVGTRQKHFYAMGTFQLRNTDHFRLSEKFEPHPASIQGKGNRIWSDSQDMKITLMAGLTPLQGLDIWVTYIYQDADKRISPPDTGPSYSIWKWPFWRRQTISLNGDYKADKLFLGGRFYFDKYDNRLEEYYNKKAFELGIHAPHSDYDEYSLGGRLTGEYEFTHDHKLAAAITLKFDDHRGLRGTILNTTMNEVMHINEITVSSGVEYSGTPFQIPLTFKAGFGVDTLTPLEYWSRDNEFAKFIQSGYYIVKTRNMLLYNWQAGLFYQFTDNHEARLTYARKNRFPTMSQRYSTRFGTNLPNSNLGPERANHFELGYSGFLFGKLHINAAAYYSIVLGKMTTIELPNPENPNALVDYSINLDSTSFYGFEFSSLLVLNDYFNFGATFSVMGYKINHLEAGGSYLPYHPTVTANGYMIIHPWLKNVSIVPRFEYASSRYGDTLGTEELEGYFLLHLRISVNIFSYVSVSAGANNILDTFYELRRYYPREGRNFYFILECKY